MKKNNLIVYNLTIKDEVEDCSGVYCVSLVKNPAVKSSFLQFSDAELTKLKFDEDQHIITGICMLADTPIFRFHPELGDHYVIFSKDTIKTIVEKFLLKNNNNLINLHHDENQVVSGVNLIESYFIDRDRHIVPSEFSDAPQGSWIVSYKIHDHEVWNKIKNSEVKGFSIEGLFEYDLSTLEKEESFEEWLNSISNLFSSEKSE